MKQTLFLILVTFLAGCASIPPSGVTGLQYGQLKSVNPKEIIFIHGMFLTAKGWNQWEDRFSEAGYKVSSPAWPLHEGSVDEQRQASKQDALGKLEFTQVLDYYRKLLKSKSVKPILIGHSMGGLISQILLSEGLAQVAIAIDSAPPNGMIVLKWSFIKSNWGVASPFANNEEPINLDVDQFSYAFLNAQDPSTRQKIYDEYYVPESRQVGKGPTLEAGEINPIGSRGPLLIIAGGEDHIIPAKLNLKNFKMYEKSPSYTEFRLFEGRDHWTLAGPGWEKVADQVDRWIKDRFAQ